MASAVAVPSRSTSVAKREVHVVGKALTYLVLLVFSILMGFPFIWTISSSLKTPAETQYFPPQIFPAIPQWDNYVHVFAAQPIAVWFLNSFIIAGLAIPGAVITGTLVAYSFARFDYPGRDFLFMVLLSTMMIPYEVTLIPQYLIFVQIHWINTYLPLILPAWGGGGAFTVFLLRQFFMTLPRELDDAASVDGANSFTVLWSIIAPLSRPALATVAILLFLSTWNDFLGPFIYLSDPRLFTMSVGLRFFQTVPESLNVPQDNLLMVATVIMSVPAIVLFFACQRYFVQGIVLSGLKL
ncbi:MAG: carbohydrate ABC transporter permease [Chloroflexota bacterium]